MLLPTSFLFRYQVAITRDSTLPRHQGTLLNLGSETRLPWLICDRDQSPFADIRLAWSDNGLGLQIEVCGRTVPLHHPSLRQKNQPVIHLWFDTRPTPDSHRAGRFCSHWRLHPTRRADDRKSPIIEAVGIARAREESALPDTASVLVEVEPRDTGYRLEAWFSRESLPGFDPDASGQLGFFYQVVEPEFGWQMPWEANGFPVDSDPSLWITLLLQK